MRGLRPSGATGPLCNAPERMRFLFGTLQKVESDFYGRVGVHLVERGHEVVHLTFSRRAAALLRRKGFEAHVLPELMRAVAPLDWDAEAVRIAQRYETPTFRDIYRTDLACRGRPEAWCVERTVRHVVAVERLLDDVGPDAVVPEVGNETLRTAVHLVGVDRGMPVLLLGYTIFPRSLMLCVDALDMPLVSRQEVRELDPPERAEVEAFIGDFKARAEPIRAYRSRPITTGRWRTLARHVTVRALWDRDNDYLKPLGWSLGLAAERFRPRIARHLYEQIDPSRPFVYFPLHLAEDYKLERLIPQWADQRWVVEQVARALPHGVDLVVKEHPIAVGRYGLRFLRRLAQMPNVRLVDPYTSSHELIGSATAVAVISSTVGLEALLYEKPVLTLGHPYYAGFGVTLDLESPRDIRHLVPAVLDFRPDPELIRRFLHAGMRRCYPGAPVLVDRSNENARDLAASLEEGMRDVDALRIAREADPFGARVLAGLSEQLPDPD